MKKIFISRESRDFIHFDLLDFDQEGSRSSGCRKLTKVNVRWRGRGGWGVHVNQTGMNKGGGGSKTGSFEWTHFLNDSEVRAHFGIFLLEKVNENHDKGSIGLHRDEGLSLFKNKTGKNKKEITLFPCFWTHGLA